MSLFKSIKHYVSDTMLKLGDKNMKPTQPCPSRAAAGRSGRGKYKELCTKNCVIRWTRATNETDWSRVEKALSSAQQTEMLTEESWEETPSAGPYRTKE